MYKRLTREDKKKKKKKRNGEEWLKRPKKKKLSQRIRAPIIVAKKDVELKSSPHRSERESAATFPGVERRSNLFHEPPRRAAMIARNWKLEGRGGGGGGGVCD